MNLRPRRAGQRSAFAVVVVMLLLALLFILVAANARTLHYLSRTVRLIEEKQQRRLAAEAAPAPAARSQGGATNALARSPTK